MAKNQLIKVICFEREIGTLGYDEDRNTSFFQYAPDFLQEGYLDLFPLIMRKHKEVQVFKQYAGETFRSLPPCIADSLPDLFGNLVFKTWLESNHRSFEQLSPLEQLAYVGNRGMGALEYEPNKALPKNTTIDIGEMAEIVQLVLDNKNGAGGEALDHESLINIFKIGTSAGGARPKILVSQNRESGKIIAGDLAHSADYDHYLIKLGLEEGIGYSREVLEYVYYLTAKAAGIEMMASKLVDDRHFATLRYDRLDGQKVHVLTACGMTGWDFKDPKVSSYENLFDLCLHLKLPHRDIEALYRRMVFNIVFSNNDDHLKNHSFRFDQLKGDWGLAPAYDITYSLNPLITYTRSSRALSILGKRTEIDVNNLLKMADLYTIKNAKGVINEVVACSAYWEETALSFNIPERVRTAIVRTFNLFQ